MNKLDSKTKPVCGSSIDIGKFRAYCQELFRSNSNSKITLIPTAESDCYPLTKTISPNEISNILKKFRSKAKSISGISPYDLKILEKSMSPFLIHTFNDIIRGCISVPIELLEASMFFIYKGDVEKLDPEKH